MRELDKVASCEVKAGKTSNVNVFEFACQKT